MQWLTYLNPLRYFLVVLRSTFLKGVGLGVPWPEMLAMGRDRRDAPRRERAPLPEVARLTEERTGR